MLRSSRSKGGSRKGADALDEMGIVSPKGPGIAESGEFRSSSLTLQNKSNITHERFRQELPMVREGTCFPEEVTATVVRTKDGSKPEDDALKASAQVSVRDVSKGDWAATRDAATGETRWRRVTNTFVRRAPELVKLTFALANDSTRRVVQRLRATPEHPFYVSGKGWVSAGELGIGTQIVTRAGPPLVLVKVERQHTKDSADAEERAGGFAVYNFTVEEDHSYFVGDAQGGAWVHNADGKGRCVSYSGDPENLRRDNFPTRPRQETVDRINATNPMDAHGNYLCAHCSQPILGKKSPEHNPPVSELWNNLGHNATQDERADSWNANIVGWAHLQCQRIQGGKTHSTSRFKQEVGPDYQPRQPRRRR